MIVPEKFNPYVDDKEDVLGDRSRSKSRSSKRRSTRKTPKKSILESYSKIGMDDKEYKEDKKSKRSRKEEPVLNTAVFKSKFNELSFSDSNKTISTKPKIAERENDPKSIVNAFKSVY